MAKDGHEVVFLVGGFKIPKKDTEDILSPNESRGKGKSEEVVARDGYHIVRMGNRYTVYWQVYKYYKKHLVGWADLVIDEVNTVPFFASLYVKERNILFFHQLSRQIWFYQIFFPLSIIGYIIEPLYLRVLSWSVARKEFSFPAGHQETEDKTLFEQRYQPSEESPRRVAERNFSAASPSVLQRRKSYAASRDVTNPQTIQKDFSLTAGHKGMLDKSLSGPSVVTVSQSTKNDLMRYGFKDEQIAIISEGIELEPVPSLIPFDAKLSTLKSAPVILALGAVRPMKRTHHIVEAFEILKGSVPNAKLVLAGATDTNYGRGLLDKIKKSRFMDSTECLGKVSLATKVELLQNSHVLVVASVKEGWGLVVTEAASQGTPSVVYNTDGLRDSVRTNETGIMTHSNTPHALAKAIQVLLHDALQYKAMRQKAWEWSRDITFDQSYKDFLKIITTRVVE